jgi:hypothetical protein
MMVLIELSEPIDYTTKPIAVKGILRLFEGNSVNQVPISLTSAKKTAG